MGIHTQLQNTAKGVREGRHQEVDRCGQVDQRQVAGQSRVHAVAQSVLRQNES